MLLLSTEFQPNTLRSTIAKLHLL